MKIQYKKKLQFDKLDWKRKSINSPIPLDSLLFHIDTCMPTLLYQSVARAVLHTRCKTYHSLQFNSFWQRSKLARVTVLTKMLLQDHILPGENLNIHVVSVQTLYEIYLLCTQQSLEFYVNVNKLRNLTSLNLSTFQFQYCYRLYLSLTKYPLDKCKLRNQCAYLLY